MLTCRRAGHEADRWGIQLSFLIPMPAFTCVTFYGFYGYRAGRKKHRDEGLLFATPMRTHGDVWR